MQSQHVDEAFVPQNWAALSFKCSKEVEWSSASQILSTCHRIDWTLLVFLLVSLQNRHSIPFNLCWMTTGSGLSTHSLVWTQVTTLIISNLPLYLTQGAAATGRIGTANYYINKYILIILYTAFLSGPGGIVFIIVWDMEQTENTKSKHFDFRLALIMRSSSLILSASQPWKKAGDLHIPNVNACWSQSSHSSLWTSWDFTKSFFPSGVA